MIVRGILSRRELLYFVAIDIVLLGVVAWWLFGGPESRLPDDVSDFAAGSMTVTSPAFKEGRAIPEKYSCDGSSVSPPLTFDDVPSGTKSLLLVIEDPDAPLGSFVHWTVWNISPQQSSLAEGEVPPGSVQGPNGTGQNKYVALCPPSGIHRYFFKLYALDEVLALPASTDVRTLNAYVAPHTLARAVLTGTYRKK